jgi:hypothetical protein
MSDRLVTPLVTVIITAAILPVPDLLPTGGVTTLIGVAG